MPYVVVKASTHDLANFCHERLVRQFGLMLKRLGQAEIDDFGNRFAVVQRDQHILGKTLHPELKKPRD